METSTFKTKVMVPDIVCGGCAGAIKNALGSVEGVSGVDVNVETKEVSIEHEESVSRDRIVDALDKAGFPAA